jgi:hypothetical protein
LHDRFQPRRKTRSIAASDGHAYAIASDDPRLPLQADDGEDHVL